MPAVLRAALSPVRVPTGERVAIKARDGLAARGHAVAAERPRPASAAATRVPTVVYPHGGPTGQAFRAFQPFKQLLVAAGFAVLDVDFRGSTGYGRAFRAGQPRRVGPRRRPRPHRRRAAGPPSQPWSDGRLGDLRRLVRRLHGPVRARRGALDVARRRRPVWRLRDRRELPPRRPARAGSTCTG